MSWLRKPKVAGSIGTDTPPDRLALMHRIVDDLVAHDARRAEKEQKVERLGLAVGFHTILGYCRVHGWKGVRSGGAGLGIARGEALSGTRD